MSFHVLLDVEPYPQPRPRLTARGGRPRAYEVPKATAWKKAAALLIQREMKRTKQKRFEGPLEVHCDFSMKRGKVPIEATRADLDNLCKSILDAATSAGLWGDDRQITRLVATKQFTLTAIGIRPYVVLRVWEAPK